MRVILAVIAAVILLNAGISSAITRHSSYLDGTVSAFDGKMIVVGGATYQVAAKCRYVAQHKRNGAYFEDSASRNDVRVGDMVNVKINGNVVDEVIIERWKR